MPANRISDADWDWIQKLRENAHIIEVQLFKAEHELKEMKDVVKDLREQYDEANAKVNSAIDEARGVTPSLFNARSDDGEEGKGEGKGAAAGG